MCSGAPCATSPDLFTLSPPIAALSSIVPFADRTGEVVVVMRAPRRLMRAARHSVRSRPATPRTIGCGSRFRRLCRAWATRQDGPPDEEVNSRLLAMPSRRPTRSAIRVAAIEPSRPIRVKSGDDVPTARALPVTHRHRHVVDISVVTLARTFADSDRNIEKGNSTTAATTGPLGGPIRASIVRSTRWTYLKASIVRRSSNAAATRIGLRQYGRLIGSEHHPAGSRRA